MNFTPFSTVTLPRIRFGEETLQELPQYVMEYGKRCLILTGGTSFVGSDYWPTLQYALEELGIDHFHDAVEGEPSPLLVDRLVSRYTAEDISVVVGIGGGSVLDAAKAVAALLPFGNSVLDHLEDVGRGLPYPGPALPFIAVPTTAGTGSEATKNAVLSEHGSKGYKKSFRHDTLVARLALVDPLLLESCPPELIAAQGMDAFTQLLESYVSVRSSPFTDALAWSGLQAVSEGFIAAWEGGNSEQARHGRAAMAYAAMVSGVTLAQAGLGSVHGLAQPLGSLYPVPHGVACGTTVAMATRINLDALRQRAPQSPALAKYAAVGRLLTGLQELGDEQAQNGLVDLLEEWTARFKLPTLGQFGISEASVPDIVANSRGNSMKTNPVVLSDEEIGAIVRARL